MSVRPGLEIGEYLRHAALAAVNFGEPGPAPALPGPIFSWMPPPDCWVGSGKFGNPCARMHAENLTAWWNSVSADDVDAGSFDPPPPQPAASAAEAATSATAIGLMLFMAQLVRSARSRAVTAAVTPL